MASDEDAECEVVRDKNGRNKNSKIEEAMFMAQCKQDVTMCGVCRCVDGYCK